jgi:hypothetical protein
MLIFIFFKALWAITSVENIYTIILICERLRYSSIYAQYGNVTSLKVVVKSLNVI